MFAICLKPLNGPSLDDIGPEDDYYQACGPLIGWLNFQAGFWDFKNRIAYLGLNFPNQRHRGKGYGTEVLEWGLRYGFLTLGVHKMALQVYDFNEVAIKLYVKVYVLLVEDRLHSRDV
jgi:RimJ/RimL family protein N-acetyltransferase